MNPIIKITPRTTARKTILVAASLLVAASCLAQSVPTVTGDARVDKLLSQMTLAEKLRLIHGTQEDAKTYQGQAGYLGGVSRLGIPGLRFADGPPGVLTRQTGQAETATMGVAATFSAQDAFANGLVIGRQYRALGIDVALQPFINIDRDLAFARGYNTFGEDPYLTSVIGAEEIKGIQSQHVMAMAKHFIGFDSDADVNSVFIDGQTLHEIYAAPFDAAVKAGVASIMCSYNHINGAFACGNAATLTKLLRDQIGFQGFVTSDWGATHAISFLNAGLDMEMPGEPEDGATWCCTYFDLKPVLPPQPPAAAAVGDQDDLANMYGGHIPEEPRPAPPAASGPAEKPSRKKMVDALKDGSITEADVTLAAGRVLLQIARFGYLDGNQKHDVTAEPVEENAKVIRRTAEDAAVLLKNDDHALPLKAADLDSVVLIGPTAAQIDSIGISGERSMGLVTRQVGPLDALKQISGNANIRFAVANDFNGTPIPAACLSHDGKPGLVRGTAQADPQINFTVKNNNALPPDSAIVWKGTLTPPHAGEYWIYLQALGANANLRVDGKRIAETGAEQGGNHGDILHGNQDNVVPTPEGLDNVRRAVQLTAGPHTIELRTEPDTSHAPTQVRLNWYTPEQRKADHEAAIDAARHAKTAVVFAWTRIEPVFGLPGDQDKLIDEIAAANPNTIVVLNTSQPVALPWAGKVKAILEMWWPGDEGGWATANVLLGKVSPAGRLPVIWGRQLTDYPATDPRHPERSIRGVDGKTTYSEGVNVGYRWFDKEKIEPLFPFGHGLSYTTFAYSGLKMAKATDGGLDVTVVIRNTGAVDSDEVPQVYLGAPSVIPAEAQFPVRSLVAFDRIHLAAGESRTVTLHVAERQLQYWSTQDQAWKTPAGPREINVGASSRDLRLSAVVE